MIRKLRPLLLLLAAALLAGTLACAHRRATSADEVTATLTEDDLQALDGDSLDGGPK